MSEKGFEPQGYKLADMKMQTHNTDTEEVFVINTETDDTDTEDVVAINTQTDDTDTEDVVAVYTQTYGTDTEEVIAINTQTYDSRKKDDLAHSKDLDVHSCSSDSSSLADFDDEEIPTEISDAISR